MQPSAFFIFSAIACIFINPVLVLAGSGASGKASGAQRLRFLVIGDSISAGFNVESLGIAPGLSWAAGRDGRVFSLRKRIQAAAPEVDLEVRNYAVPGAKSADLKWQLRLTGKYRADIATLLIGANDLCSGEITEGVDGYRQAVRAAVTQLAANNPLVKIVLVPVPDVVNLRTQGVEKGCSDKWGKFDICQRMLGPDVDAETLRQVAAERVDLEAALAGIAADFPRNVVYAAGLEKFGFNSLHVSGVDCFHPSVSGQRLLADLVWNDGFSAALLETLIVRRSDSL